MSREPDIEGDDLTSNTVVTRTRADDHFFRSGRCAGHARRGSGSDSLGDAVDELAILKMTFDQPVTGVIAGDPCTDALGAEVKVSIVT